jgi:hypothetical protein
LPRDLRQKIRQNAASGKAAGAKAAMEDGHGQG